MSVPLALYSYKVGLGSFLEESKMGDPPIVFKKITTYLIDFASTGK